MGKSYPIIWRHLKVGIWTRGTVDAVVPDVIVPVLADAMSTVVEPRTLVAGVVRNEVNQNTQTLTETSRNFKCLVFEPLFRQ